MHSDVPIRVKFVSLQPSASQLCRIEGRGCAESLRWITAMPEGHSLSSDAGEAAVMRHVITFDFDI